MWFSFTCVLAAPSTPNHFLFEEQGHSLEIDTNTAAFYVLLPSTGIGFLVLFNLWKKCFVNFMSSEERLTIPGATV